MSKTFQIELINWFRMNHVIIFGSVWVVGFWYLVWYVQFFSDYVGLKQTFKTLFRLSLLTRHTKLQKILSPKEFLETLYPAFNGPIALLNLREGKSYFIWCILNAFKCGWFNGFIWTFLIHKLEIEYREKPTPEPKLEYRNVASSVVYFGIGEKKR